MELFLRKFSKGLISGVFLVLFVLLIFVSQSKASKIETQFDHSKPNTASYTPRNASYSATGLKTHLKIQNTEVAAPIPLGYCLTVPILMYHHIQPYEVAKQLGQTALTVDSGVFDQQMAYLASQGYTSISADQLANALRTHSGLPPKPIMVTVDDGYKDAFTYAYPIFQKYHIIGNLMIPTGLMENNDYLSWADIKNMVGSGMIFAYDHTWSHASLAGVSNEKAQMEILTARDQLQSYLGRQISIFAYPYGSENGRITNLLSQDGFVAAFSTIPGWTQCDSFIMTLHRNRVGNSSLSSYGL